MSAAAESIAARNAISIYGQGQVIIVAREEYSVGPARLESV